MERERFRPGYDPPALGAAWGKASTGAIPHPLACHVLDTAAVAKLVFPVLLGPTMRTELLDGFAVLPDPLGWIALLCGLHDLGKFSPAFQALRASLAKELLGTSAVDDVDWLDAVRVRTRTDTPHGVITELHMQQLLLSWGADRLTAARISAAIGGHHGYFAESKRVQQARGAINDHGGAKWASWRQTMVEALAQLVALPLPSAAQWQQVRLSQQAAVSLAALTSVSDWIASDNTNFPYAGAGVDLSQYTKTRAAAAREAMDRLGWRPWSPPADTSFTALFGPEPPRPVQLVVQQWSASLTEPALLIVEAPTGEGKTKAALQFATTLVRQRGLAGMFVALPTRATSNQILDVVTRLLDGLGDSTTVGLVHSSANDYLAARAAEQRETAAPGDVSVDDPADGDVKAREWFTRKKNLLIGLGVGTVDQPMKAVIRSGHVFVRLAGLSNKVVVIDEMHAYDTYMSTLLDRLLMWLGRMGVPVVVLSATLPSRRRTELVAAWQAGAQGCGCTERDAVGSAAAYPRATLALPSRPARQVPVTACALNSDRRVQLSRVDDTDVVRWVLNRVRDGGCVAVIHNLVSRVASTCAALRSEIARLPTDEQPELIAITGRMSTKERHCVETELHGRFGPEGVRPHRAIVVGTQVLEQSLDLDFDAMVSDLAPIDALIQRVGRVHRHSRTGRGPLTLAITGVADTSDGPVFPPYLSTVYQPWVLLRTWAVLRDRQVLVCPDDVQGLVDDVYGPDEAVSCPAGWQDAWDRAATRMDAALAHERHRAGMMFIPMPASIQHPRELTVRPRNPSQTRLSSGRSR